MRLLNFWNRALASMIDPWKVMLGDMITASWMALFSVRVWKYVGVAPVPSAEVASAWLMWLLYQSYCLLTVPWSRGRWSMRASKVARSMSTPGWSGKRPTSSWRSKNNSSDTVSAVKAGRSAFCVAEGLMLWRFEVSANDRYWRWMSLGLYMK